MSHGNTRTQQARYRSHCTGTGHQICVEQLHSAAAHPVPTPDFDQARLEAALFEGLDGTIDYCAHPAGIARTTPSSDHLALALDSKLGPKYRLPEHSLGMILPTHYTGPEETENVPGGYVGVRLRAIDDAGLHLGLAGTDAHVTLTGPSTEEWHEIVAAMRADCQECHLEPLWDARDLTGPEADYLAREHRWESEKAERAWLASGLLRRIGLFHTVSKPYSMRYWRHGLGWKFEVRYEHGVAVNHDAVVEHLTHRRWGMPLQVFRESCACKSCTCDGGAERSCWFTFVGDQPKTKIIIHFRQTRAHYDMTDPYDRLTGAGASRTWLQQALPSHHEQATCPPAS
ncbi:hypothetical protein EES37_38135 [Streptomyces sp. ADI91-18]|nr:hypothetical protein EES37_38135 [Streptomyces sp. ADI91-18]